MRRRSSKELRVGSEDHLRRCSQQTLLPRSSERCAYRGPFANGPKQNTPIPRGEKVFLSSYSLPVPKDLPTAVKDETSERIGCFTDDWQLTKGTAVRDGSCDLLVVGAMGRMGGMGPMGPIRPMGPIGPIRPIEVPIGPICPIGPIGPMGPISSHSRLDLEVLYFDRQFAFELFLFGRHRLTLVGDLFETRLLFICFCDVAGDKLFGLGRFCKSLDILAKAFLIFRDRLILFVGLFKCRVDLVDLHSQIDEPR